LNVLILDGENEENERLDWTHDESNQDVKMNEKLQDKMENDDKSKKTVLKVAELMNAENVRIV
jgi:hypothetical protein